MTRLVIAMAFVACGESNLPSKAPELVTPTPRFEIDHAHPEWHVALSPSLGDRAVIERVAIEARALGDEPIASALAWFDAHTKNDIEHPYVWRPFERVVTDGYWMWCADRAVAIGTLLRALGVPTIWVKSMDVAWIADLNAGLAHPFRGHVFLEVFVRGAWRLLDPVTERLYDAYDPSTHSMPGQRFAYDKGDDPFAMILSLRELMWRAQTRTYFEHFDSARLEGGIAGPSHGKYIGPRN